MAQEQSDYAVQGFPLWKVLVSVVVLGVVGTAVWLVKDYLPIVGYITLACVAVLPVLGLLYVVNFVVRALFRAEIYQIGRYGTLIRWFHRVSPYGPMGKDPLLEEPEIETTIEEVPPVPSLLELLQSRVLTGVQLLLGYDALSGVPVWGTWDNVRTFAVAGKSRSGKTVTATFFILQALLAGARVYVCDLHAHKPTGLLKVLEPVIPYLTVARTVQDIVNLVDMFSQEMTAREHNKSLYGNSDTGWKPFLIVFDEWTKLLRDVQGEDKERVVNTVLNCAEAWAGFNGYALVSGHEWTARESGGTKGAAVRRGFHATFVHRLDFDYAKFLLVGASGRKAALKASTLPVGRCLYQDTGYVTDSEDIQELLIPYYGDKKEAVKEVASMLQGILQPHPQVPQLPVPDTQPVNDKQPRLYPINTHVEPVQALSERVTEEINASEPEHVLQSDVNTEVNTLAISTVVKRLYKQGVSHRDIAYAVGLYGPKYGIYKQLCSQLGIDTTERVVK